MQFGTIAYSSGSVGAAITVTVKITLPIAYAAFCTFLSNCNNQNFTCAAMSTDLATITSAFNNKNNSNKASFSSINYISIGY